MLYNEERPVRFSDAIGQDAVKMVLTAQVKKQAFSQAYIFAGHHGSGKTTFARILGKAAVCEHPVDGEPCNECEACRNFSSSIDVIEIDAASNTGVDAIRDKVIEAVRYSPVMMKRKIIIIDECHMLSTSAFNALLKTLEEPPKNVIIFLCTTELHKVPKTIVSRCQKFIFSGISTDEVTRHITEVSGKHGFNIEEKAARAIAKAADGSMRDALSLLEQAASEGDITYEKVENMLGNGNMEIVDDIITYTGNGEMIKASEAVDIFLGSSDINHLIDSMLERIIERVIDGDKKDYLDILDKLGQIRGKSATVTTLKTVIYSMSAKEDRIGALERRVEELSREVSILKNMSQNEPSVGISETDGNNGIYDMGVTESMTDKKPEFEAGGNNETYDTGNSDMKDVYSNVPDEMWNQDFSDNDRQELEDMGFSDVGYEDMGNLPDAMQNGGSVSNTVPDANIDFGMDFGIEKENGGMQQNTAGYDNEHNEGSSEPVMNRKPKYRSPFDW